MIENINANSKPPKVDQISLLGEPMGDPIDSIQIEDFKRYHFSWWLHQGHILKDRLQYLPLMMSRHYNHLVPLMSLSLRNYFGCRASSINCLWFRIPLKSVKRTHPCRSWATQSTSPSPPPTPCCSGGRKPSPCQAASCCSWVHHHKCVLTR